MKFINNIIVAQANPTQGDIKGNFKIAKKYIKKASKIGADAIVFSQMFLVGYPICRILEHYPILKKQNDIYLEKLAATSTITVLMGCAEGMAVLENGKIKEIINKSKIIKIGGKNTLVVTGDEFKKAVRSKGADRIIICTSTQTRACAEFEKNKLFSSIAKRNKLPVIIVNQVGATDGVCFEGGSRMYDRNGKIVACAKFFKEDLLKIDLKDFSKNKIAEDLGYLSKNKEEFSLNWDWDLKRTYLSILLAIKDYFKKNGFKKAVLGLSGGLDSSICATLLAHALGSENILGVSMPSEISSKGSRDDAKKLSENLGIKYVEMPIGEVVKAFSNDFNKTYSKIKFKKYQKSYASDNIQARSRATILWGLSNKFEGFLPIATCDKSETFMGYATINGDMTGGFAPINDVTKTKAKALGVWINKRFKKEIIPQVILEKKPSAELEISKETGKLLLAEEALMPYEFLDEAIWRFENFNETLEDMMKSNFIYEKKENISKTQKKEWLRKFFTRLKNARYKQTIAPPFVVADKKSLHKNDFDCPITFKLNI